MVSLQYVFACGFSNEPCVKMLIHTLHKKMVFSPVCVCMCLFKLKPSENVDAHTKQENGFSPVCDCMCLIKEELSENSDAHTSQENGFFSRVFFHMFF